MCCEFRSKKENRVGGGHFDRKDRPRAKARAPMIMETNAKLFKLVHPTFIRHICEADCGRNQNIRFTERGQVFLNEVETEVNARRLGGQSAHYQNENRECEKKALHGSFQEVC
jgi:hypothetical protein